MFSIVSSARATRASNAASASTSRTRPVKDIKRRSTLILPRSAPGFPSLTDSSDPDQSNDTVSNTRRSNQRQRFQEESDNAISEEDLDQEALDEMLVLEQLTPRPVRRTLLEPVDLDTTQTALDRFRLREQQGQRASRASLAAPAQAGRSSISSRSQTSRRSRQSAPVTRTANSEASGSRSLHTARSQISTVPSTTRQTRRPLATTTVNFNDTSPSETETEAIANTTMARPGQRLRPSLSLPDGRLDVPTIEERCAALVITAKGVLHFYMNLYTPRGWRPESFDEMLRNWIPFESYKTNQLLAEGQYMHHFIDIEQVTRSLAAAGEPRPDGLEEAMKMANCATFVHYVQQLPTDPKLYGRNEGREITGADVSRVGLRRVGELSDARRVFLRWILPSGWEVTDEVLGMLLDLSIQIYIHRVERTIEQVRAGEITEDAARRSISDHLIDLMSGDVVRHSLQRVKRQRKMSKANIERMVQRYETFANVRQTDLQQLGFDINTMRTTFSFRRMAADLTGYVHDVVREVDRGMRSTTLPLIIDRLERENSSFVSSDPSEPVVGSSSVLDDDADSMYAGGPSQSTPKATQRSGGDSQPYASQFVGWLDEMLDEDPQSSRVGLARNQPRTQEEDEEMDLTETQKIRELDRMLLEGTTDEGEPASSTSVDLDIASSPPRGKLSTRLSAALNSSGRTTTRVADSASASVSDAVEVSESGTDAAAESRRSRDGPFDSPAKEKANRLGFDSQNRLVRRTEARARKNQRLLDGSKAGVREERFDSQGEEEEDVFLEKTVKGRTSRAKSKGKGKARERVGQAEVSVVEGDAVEGSARPRRNLRSTAASGQAEQGAESEAVAEEEPEEEDDGYERQTARRRGTRSAARQLQLKQESLSPTKAQLKNARDPADGEPASTTARVTRTTTGGDSGPIGLGRGLPDGENRTSARILSTASGRLHEEGEASSDESESQSADATARIRIDPTNAEFAPTRATPDENFLGDDNSVILNRRAAIDAAIAARKPRPGTLHFRRPEADDEAMPLLLGEDGEEGGNIDAIARRRRRRRRDGDVAAILLTSNTRPQRRIGPYHPENSTRGQGAEEEADPSSIPDLQFDDEVDELDEDPPQPSLSRRRRNTHTEPLGQSVRVEPYKRSNLYVTGHNMTGRSRWTPTEVQCLLDCLHELARYKKVAPKFKVYTEILKRHGVNGTQSRILARWNNVQLKDKSRNELIRMKREGKRIPYWKRLLHANIWKPKPVVPVGREREETEDVPELGSGVELPSADGGGSGRRDGEMEEEDVIRDDVESAAGDEDQVEGERRADDGVELAIEAPGDRSGSNPLRNEP
ncbi:hypothetical protein NDA14_007292 [Ustilago hordei]|nr:hypothetical protein NDA14_007292 [Ustilago hordei]